MHKTVKRKREKAVRKKMGKDGQSTASDIRMIAQGIEKMEESVKLLLSEGAELDEFGEVIMPQITEFNNFTSNNEEIIAKLERSNLNKLDFEELIDIGNFIDEVNEKSAAIQATFENYTGGL